MAKAASIKKISIKAKRRMRRTSAVVLFLTAIIIAAIPTQKASAELNTPVTYPTTTDISTLIAATDLSYVKPALADEETAYCILPYGSDSYRIVWRYKFWIDTSNSRNWGVISSYNNYSSPTDGVLAIENSVVTEYRNFLATDVSALYTLGAANAVITLTNSEGTNISKTYQTLLDECFNIVVTTEDVGGTSVTTRVPDYNYANVSSDIGIQTKVYMYAHYNYKAADNYNAFEVVDNRSSTATDTMVNVIKDPSGDWVIEKVGNVLKQKTIGGIGDGVFQQSYANSIKSFVLPAAIKIIGNNAFAQASSLESISIAGVTSIGHQAFKNCEKLTTVTIGAGITNLGVETFYGCTNLTNVALPNTITKISTGAFAECSGKLTAINLSTLGSNLVIGDFSFFNCPKLNNVIFQEGTIEIGDCAFAVNSSHTIPSGTLQSIILPSNATTLGTGIFYGRNTLLSVTMPSTYGNASGKQATSRIDDAFFYGCYNLQKVVFPESCLYASFESDAFETVSDLDAFYVEGPEKISATAESLPRTSAHAAGVTYKYTNLATGAVYFEIADEAGNYYRVNQTGVLEGFTVADPLGTSDINLVIKDKVGNIDIVSVAAGCFDAYKNRIASLTIQDNSLGTIADGAFENYTYLKKVTIGNSVITIGTNAFKGCSAITDVVFHTPINSNYGGVTIGTDAFLTGTSGLLVFHGDIVKGYDPFDWAMNADNYINENTGRRVCYQSNAPTNLTVIHDNKTNLVTLIDYPHYQDIDIDNKAYIDEQIAYFNAKYDDTDIPNNGKTFFTGDFDNYSIIEKYEYTYIDRVANPALPAASEEWEILSPYEKAIVDSTFDIEIPAGIESIDAAAFFNAPENSANYEYISSKSTLLNGGPNTKVALYSGTTNLDTLAMSHGGLFSGYFVDGTTKEKRILGNDYITTITMADVTYLPNYCFESCENLENVSLGVKCTDVGTAPFIGCTKLTGVSGNTAFTYENGILYSTNTDGTLNIIECLSARGSLVGESMITTETDPLLTMVSTISPGAFQNCDELSRINLTDAKALKKIPSYCFNSCDNLAQVILPTSIKEIGAYSFVGSPISGNVSVTIPGTEVSIMDSAFTTRSGLIRTYEDSAAETYALYKNLDIEIIADIYNVVFLNYDGTSLNADQSIEEGKAATPPVAPTRAGYIFSGWSKDYSNITADTIIIARYTVDPNATVLNPTPTPGATTPGAPTPTTTTTVTNTAAAASAAKFKVTVTDGSGSGSFVAGVSVMITANNPPAGLVFDKWVTTSSGVNVASSTSTGTTFTMPGNDVALTATYKSPTAAATGTTGTSATGGTGTGTTGTGTTGTGTTGTGTTGTSTGTVITITKPGFSNTDKATATVSGSTDNYVVKISDSEEARAAIEQALLADRETLDTIKYFPMDITLYDSTGTTLITDTTGLSVNITIPIPDELIEYAGNNKVAAVVNGALEKLNPKFTTINGVACISFTATHFSPYTIYVDTSNLTAGTITDASPKTGDFIHPKWFLVIGLCSISGVLFLKKDKREKVKYA